MEWMREKVTAYPKIVNPDKGRDTKGINLDDRDLTTLQMIAATEFKVISETLQKFIYHFRRHSGQCVDVQGARQIHSRPGTTVMTGKQ